MTIETAPFVNALNSANPAGGDAKNEGDNHIRLIKAALIATFPNFNGACSGSQTDILKNHWTGGAAPTVNNDSSQGYSVGSWWLDGSGYLYLCTSASVGAAQWAQQDAAGGQSGYRNRLVNGGMRIDQRGSFGARTVVAAAAYSWHVDRFYDYCSGANVGVTYDSAYGIVRYAGALGVTGIGFGTRLEAAQTTDMGDQPVTFSVYLANALLGTTNWALYRANTTDTFGTRAAPTRTLIASGSFTGITSTAQRFSATISAATMAGHPMNGLELVLTVGAQTGATWTIFRPQLEVGSLATIFERMDYGDDLRRCQRYYEKGSYSFQLPIASASVVASYLSHVDFKATKRAIPTITGTNDQGGAFSSGSVGVDSCQLGRSDVIANRNNSGTYTADAEMYT